MKKLIGVSIVALSFAPSGVLAQERVGDAALGAVSGAIVLGPVGALAGAVVGYTAGPAISHSWGKRGAEPQRHERSTKRSAPATEKTAQPAASTPEPAATEKPAQPATSSGPEANNSMPPVQPLD
jgi:hypothetical protein